MKYKYKLSVCLSIKNEAVYMDDFLHHYINQGVDHFYIINNGSEDNIEDVIRDSIYNQNITLITDNRDMNILKTDSGAQGHKELLDENLYELIKSETEWAILIDADEFMLGKNGHTIKSYLSTIDQSIGCIYVMWNIINPCKEKLNEIIDNFSLNNKFKRLNYDCIYNLSNRIINANDFGKSIFRTSMLKDSNKLWLHKVCVNGIIINNYGINITTNPYDNCNNIPYSEEKFRELNITLNHHAIRNKKDYEKKKNQIDVVVHKNYFIMGLFDMIELENNNESNLFIEFNY